MECVNIIELRCPSCSEAIYVPDVLRCPFCKMKMQDKTEEYATKHVRKCAFRFSPYQYSDRKPGRPSHSEVKERFGL